MRADGHGHKLLPEAHAHGALLVHLLQDDGLQVLQLLRQLQGLVLVQKAQVLLRVVCATIDFETFDCIIGSVVKGLIKLLGYHAIGEDLTSILTFIQGHTDFNNENHENVNYRSNISETVQQCLSGLL